MRIHLLGTLRVEVGGSTVGLGPLKQRALLAILALHPQQVIATERLVDMIWGVDAPRTASHSIQIYVSNLRKALAPEERAIVTLAPGYSLHVDAPDVDVFHFQRLVESSGADEIRAALQLWEGEPLADFAYDEWAQPHIRRLNGLHARAIELLAETELEDGRGGDIVEMLEELIDREPLREHPRRLLMLALYRDGRQAQALRILRDYRRALGDEMGIEPSPDLCALEEQILLQDPALTAPRVVPAGRSRPPRNPYKGLGPFDEIDAGDFHGRDKLVAEMLDVISGGSRLVVVVGPSGSGKSSAVRAGLIPALRSGGVTGSESWIVAVMTPEDQPFERLAAALKRGSAVGGPDYLSRLTESDTGLLSSTLDSVPDPFRELVLVIDQFEELFTLVSDGVRRRFLEAVVVAVTDPRSRIRVVVTLRADFYDRPLLARRFAPVFASNVLNVVPMTAPELEAAIIRPAEGVGLVVEPALLAQLVADMGEESAALPLLQFALTELVDHRVDGKLTLDAYQRLGGLQGALTQEAEGWFGSLTTTEQDDVRRIMLRLVRWERGSEPTRRRVDLAELREVGDVDEIISALIGNRLLTADRDPMTGRAAVQVTHEALLTGWTRLRGWIGLHSTDLERHGMLTAAASEWEESDRDPDFLLTGGRLATLESWAAETDLTLGSAAGEYLAASVERRRTLEAEEGERRIREDLLVRRARRRLWGSAAAIVLAAGALTYSALALITEPIPPIAFVSQFRDGGVSDMLMDGYDRAAEDVDDQIAHYPSDWTNSAETLERVSTSGARYVLAWVDATQVEQIAAAYPDVNYAVLDAWQAPLPNTLYVYFKAYESAYLVGAIAALKSQTGIIGFVGGLDIGLIHAFQAGYEAGAREVRPDIEIIAVYLTPHWDHSGFQSETLAQLQTGPIYQAGADVVFQVAGRAGRGVFEAAVAESERQGRHLWAIGVDSDQYLTVLDPHYGPDGSGGPDPRRWQPHILTSMLKKFDVVVYDLLLQFSREEFEGGDLGLGLAEDAVGYSTTGGFIDDIIPVVEDLKARIISGEIIVPFTLDG